MNFGVHPVGHVALPVQGFAGESLSEASWSKLRAESVRPEGSGHEPRGLGFRGLGFKAPFKVWGWGLVGALCPQWENAGSSRCGRAYS